MSRTRLMLALVLALVAALAVMGAALAAPGDPSEPAAFKDSERLRRAVTVDGILKHERRFQQIARANDGTRASGTPGYDASAQYVAQRLRAAGYEVAFQPFSFPFFEETAPTALERVSPTQETYRPGEDFSIMEYSGSGEVTASIEPVDLTLPPSPQPGSTSGCEAADFEGFTQGNVALIQRGTCPFGQKAENAENAGASAVLIFNEGQPGRTEALSGTLGGPGYGIPVVGTSFEVGNELAQLDQAEDVTVRVSTETLSEERQTKNVIADTKGGRRTETVVVGAHLDSVPEGAGINDNGSGSAQNLEIALQMSELGVRPANKVRFIFFGAEESGLLGSEYYVSQLSSTQKDSISTMLNFDMVGSPNFVRFVYDGDGSSTDDPATPEVEGAGPRGSAGIERVFRGYFSRQGLESEPTAFDGRSDYGPFIAEGIPAGGLFSGAEGIKTAEEAATYGGVAGRAYDPCYHSACDDITNLNNRALNQFSDAAAHATAYFARYDAADNNGRSVAASVVTDDAKGEGIYRGSHAVE